ncbi:MAG: hypothetical protein HUU34_10160 [Saprospiraceae bacterium]|nr:hypothetical protein [Saprospiraceae bacterium]
MKNIVLTLLLLLFAMNVYCQSADNILVFAPKSDFLLAHIEKELVGFQMNDRKLFDKVTNLNRIYSNVQSEGTLREVIGSYSNKFYQLSPEAKAIRAEIESLLTAHNYFLLVNINTLDLLIEYQLQLYHTSNQTTQQFEMLNDSRLFPVNSVQNPVKIENFILNPSDPEYIYLIQDNLKKLFKGLNHPPEALITINGIPNKKDSVYYFSTQDTFRIGSELSVDLDTPRKRWIATWRQISPKGYLNIDPLERIVLNEDTPSNILNIATPGQYLIGMTISDGIDYSSEDTLCIMIIQKPNIYVNEDYSILYDYLSILKSKGTKNKFNKKYTITCSNYQDLASFNIYNTSVNLQVDSLRMLSAIVKQKLKFQSAAQMKTENSSYFNFITIKNDRNPFGYNIELISIFPETKTNEITFYLKNNSGIKSNEIKIRQDVYRRSPIDFFISTGIRRIRKNFITLDSLLDRRDNYSYLNTIIQASLYITKHFSISGGITIPHTDAQVINGYTVRPYLSASYRLNFYYFKSLNHLPVKWSYGIYMGFYHVRLTTDPLEYINSNSTGGSSGCSCAFFSDTHKVIIPEFGIEFNYRLFNKEKTPLYLALTLDSSIGSFDNLISSSIAIGLRYNLNGD